MELGKIFEDCGLKVIRIHEVHGGEIIVATKEKEGIAFMIYLPVA